MCGGATWAPSAPHRARAPCLSPVPLQTVADLLRVGISWTELSDLTTFLLFLKGGSQAEATATAREFSELIFTLFPFSGFFFFFYCRVNWPGISGKQSSSFGWDLLPDIWPLTDMALMTIPWIPFWLIGRPVGVMTGSYGGVCVHVNVHACPIYAAVRLVHLASTSLSGHLVTDCT